MDKEQSIARGLPHLQFRVLIIGRRNAGKTTILRRVCGTTDSPEIWRTSFVNGRKKRTQIHQLDSTSERGEHEISDELVFTENPGYVFHDSRGFENADEKQLKIIQEFINDRSGKKRLQEKLHAIWFCIPTDKSRPGLDIAPFKKIFPEEKEAGAVKVPVIAIFTKYDALRHRTRCKLQDTGKDYGDANTECETETIFAKEYLGRFDGKPTFVRLEDMDQLGRPCDKLIETTRDALNPEVVTLMLLAVQRANVQLSGRSAVRWALARETSRASIALVGECLKAFPYAWFFSDAADAVARRDLFADDFLFDRDDRFSSDDRKTQIIHTALAPSLDLVGRPSSPRFLIIVTIIILHHATLAVARRQISTDEALQQALAEYANSPIGGQVQNWLTEFPAAEEDEIVKFINENELPMI